MVIISLITGNEWFNDPIIDYIIPWKKMKKSFEGNRLSYIR